MTNHYAVLGVGIRASAEDIKSAYRKRARQVHPDAGHRGAQDFQVLQTAYDTLRDPTRRAAYDRELCAWAARLGRVLCEVCAVVNQVPAIPAGFYPTCGACGARLAIDELQRRGAARVALTYQVVGLVEDVGVEVLSMARDAAVEGFIRLRTRIGIPKHSRRR